MRMGAILGIFADPSRSDALVDQIGSLTGAGFDSLWAAHGVGRGFMHPDPLVVLATAAAVTDDVELGTAVVQSPLYHPMDLAHRVLTLQQLAGDRLILGIGAGSTEQDFRAYGLDYSNRFNAFDASADALSEIFRTGQHGTSDLSPWPAMTARPKLFFGTWGKGVERAAQEFDGWIASANYRSVDQVVAAHERYRASGGGRAVVSTIQIGADTDLGELKEKLHRFAEAGFDDAVVLIQPGGPDPEVVRGLLN